MSEYNGTKVSFAVRPDIRIGALRTSQIGKHYAYKDGYDGYNVVEVLPLELTPTAADYLGGNDLKKVLVIPEGLPSVKLPVKSVFPNVITCVVEEKSLIVGNLDAAFADMNVTVVVPNTLKSAYESAYSGATNLTFDSWVLDNEFTIPYIGDSDLTIAYVDLVVQNASGDISLVDKVVVPSDFTSYETDVFNYIFLKFGNATEIECGSVRLPSAYQEVEYIDSDGTQRIDTGVYLTNIRVVSKFQMLETTDYKAVFGYHFNNSNSFCLRTKDSIIANGVVSLYGYLPLGETIWEVDMQMASGDSYLIANGVTNVSSNTTYETSSLASYTLQVFHAQMNSSGTKMRLFNMSIYQDGSKVREFVPCYRKSDNVLGLYDLINDVFYINAETGSFTKGAVINFAISRPALSTCTIYYDENTSHTLTPAIVQNTLTRVPEFSTAKKVIVPVWFTEYQSGSITAIESSFSDMEVLTTCYEAGNIDLDMNGDVVAKIASIEKSLDLSLAKARNIAYTWTKPSDTYGLFQNDPDLTIIPPLDWNDTRLHPASTTTSLPFDGSQNIVYISPIVSQRSFNDDSPNRRLPEAFTTNNYLPNLVEFEISMYGNMAVVGTLFYNFANIKKVVINQSYATTIAYPNNINALVGMTNIETLILGNWVTQINISASTKLTRKALVDLFNSLGTPSSPQYLTIGATNLAKLTADDIAIATAKNWNVVA